jgi:hypothetical protein
VFDCANDACGDNANADTVANAATRNKSRDFKIPPQPASALEVSATERRIREGVGFL